MVYLFCHHDLNDTITIMIILKEILVLVELFLFFYLDEDGQTIVRHGACTW